MAEIITKQKLVEANENASAWEKYWAGGDDENVITRLNKLYPTHAKALKILMENGGLQPFETEVQLLATVPVVSPTAAKALDTKKVWIWKQTSAEGVEPKAYAWVDTGKSELDIVGGSTPNLYIGTEIELNFNNNTLSGGGGLVSYGTFFIDGIPENQTIVLEPESEEYPNGLRKICINKESKLFKIFNSIEDVTSEYVLLGYLLFKKWNSIGSGKQPTVIADSSVFSGYVSDLKYASDAEIVGGSLVLNKEAKTINGSCTIYSPTFRNETVANVSYTGNLTAIVLDMNDGLIKALTGDDVVSPSHIVIAKVKDDFIFTSSINGAFTQEGVQKFKIFGKVNNDDLTSEPAFLSDDLKLTVNFQSGVLTVNQNGYVFFDGTFASLNNASGSSFDTANPVYLRFVVLSKSTNKIEIKESLSNTYSRSSILIGYIFNYSFYGFGDAKNRVTIVNSAGQIVDNSDQDTFDELKQRALIPNKLFFINDRSLPLYKDSIFSNPKVGLEKVRTWIDTNNTDTLKRYVPVQQQTILNPSDLSNTAQFVYAHASVANKRYWKNVAVNKAAQSKLSRSFNMLCFGDSLTQVGTPWTLKNKLESLGATVTPVGTFWSTETPNELPSEGRGYWNYREFIGKDNNSSGTPHTRSEGGKTRTTKFETPFLKLATTQDKTDHPTWCFRFTGAQKELSYTEDPNKAGNFYIFDFDWYLTQHSVANPDFITIGLSTNDINLDRDVYSRAEVMQFMQLGLEIMVKQIHKVLPNVPIGVIPCPAWSATENGYATFSADTANWVELCIKKVAELKATHSNIEVIPVHLHMNRDMGYPLTGGSALTTDSDITVSTVSDWVHYDQIGRDQYAEVVAAWLANSI
ncbi:SGNH/GDSL hydrolase family protein [Acinetobacter guillouiae]|uniref:SGNH/GDSL hydrolase family protein n=1 Tax=Acinetobacter guillouiae TaxID=106649 RepID=UPI0020906D9C|nr:SGNH/GDSL hydrolase family protein [Acinetobacter guillouiae]